MAAQHLSIDQVDTLTLLYTLHVLLTHLQFFSRLSSLFDSHRNSTHGSIFLTQKRRTYPNPSANLLGDPDPALSLIYQDTKST